MKSRNHLEHISLGVMAIGFLLMFFIPGMWMVLVICGAFYVISQFLPRQEMPESDVKGILLLSDLTPKIRILAFLLWASVILFAVYIYYYGLTAGWLGAYAFCAMACISILRWNAYRLRRDIAIKDPAQDQS